VEKDAIFSGPSFKLTTGNNFKKSSEYVNDETATSVEINLYHKIGSTSNTSCLLCDWPTVKDMYILFSA